MDSQIYTYKYINKRSIFILYVSLFTDSLLYKQARINITMCSLQVYESKSISLLKIMSQIVFKN